MMHRFAGVLLLVGGMAATTAGNAQTLKVTEMVFCKSVENLEPTGPADVFADTTGRVFCFTRIEGASETTITHRWFFGDKQIAEIELPVRSAAWRTFSSKKMVPAWRGEWTVRIFDENEGLLREGKFMLGEREE